MNYSFVHKYLNISFFHQIRKFLIDCGPIVGINPNRKTKVSNIENMRIIICKNTEAQKLNKLKN